MRALLTDELFPRRFEAAAARAFAGVARRFSARARADSNPTGGVNSGTTAACAVVVNNQLYVADVGDSIVVLCRRRRAVLLSRAHMASSPRERVSIYVCRYDVLGLGVCQHPTCRRVWCRQAALSCTRWAACAAAARWRSRAASAMCDIRWRVMCTVLYDSLTVSVVALTLCTYHTQPHVSPLPHTARTLLGAADAFVIVASDGVFDVVSHDDAVQVAVTSVT
jgi:serine/threonine protein phosphatase PrpC